jgi:hypothetical protein
VPIASATLIKRFAKRDRRIGSGVEEGILCLRFELEMIRSKVICQPWSEAGHHSHRDIFGSILQIDKQLGGVAQVLNE